MKYLEEFDWTKGMIHAMFVIVVLVILMLLYWGFRPYTVYYNVVQPYDIVNENNEVKRGEAVLVRQEYCKAIGGDATLVIILEDGYYETLRIIQSRADPGCRDGVSQSAVIPTTSAPGEYRLRYQISVRVNPVRTIHYEFVTEYFTVIE